MNSLWRWYIATLSLYIKYFKKFNVIISRAAWFLFLQRDYYETIMRGVSRFLVTSATNSNMIRHKLLNKEPFHSRYAPILSLGCINIGHLFFMRSNMTYVVKNHAYVSSNTTSYASATATCCQIKVERSAKYSNHWNLKYNSDFYWKSEWANTYFHHI